MGWSPGLVHGPQPATSASHARLASANFCTRSASYKNKENIDLSRVPAYGRHEKDTGSSEIQIARLSARIDQISDHLKMNRKDFAAKRGLVALLSQRKTLLQYLYRENRWGVGPRDTRGVGQDGLGSCSSAAMPAETCMTSSAQTSTFVAW